jgi:hypothetical protein
MNEMNKIVNEVTEAICTWENEAKAIGLSRSEISMMRPAFKV